MRSLIRRTVVPAVLAIAAVLGLAGTAQAVPVTWTLQGVTFDDGGTATGSFAYDADVDEFSDIDITTSINAGLGLGTHYGNTVVSFGTSILLDIVFATPAIGQPRLVLQFDFPMTNAGGTLALNGVGELICTTLSCGGLPFLRLVSPAAITTVPEPATAAILGAGLVGLGLIRRRRAA